MAQEVKRVYCSCRDLNSNSNTFYQGQLTDASTSRSRGSDVSSLLGCIHSLSLLKIKVNVFLQELSGHNKNSFILSVLPEHSELDEE